MRKTPMRPQPRWDDMIKSERQAKRRPVRERSHRRAWVYLGMVLALLAILVTALYAWIRLKLETNEVAIAEISQQVPNEPMNVLVVGSDSRAVLSEEEQAHFDPTGSDRKTGKRADTIILLHVDQKRDQVVVLHFPRDLLVKLPDGKEGKVNSAYQQGVGAVVQTIQTFSGLPIHHYVEVDFVGFRNIVNAVGGVKVEFEEPINDSDSGLNVPKGCVLLNGDQALGFVRVRKIDDDFGRIARQQLFMSLMMDKILSARTLVDIPRLVRLVNLFAANVTTDTELGINEIRILFQRIRSFDPKRVDMRVVPSAPRTIRRVSYVVANDKQTRALMEGLKNRTPLPDWGRTGVSAINPEDVRVSVLNGTEVSGLGAKAAEELKPRGFQIVGGPANADRSDYAKTTVFHKEGFQDQAALVATPYGAQVKIAPATITVEAEIALVVGRDYAEGRATPPPPPPPPKGKAAKAPAKPLVHRCGE